MLKDFIGEVSPGPTAARTPGAGSISRKALAQAAPNLSASSACMSLVKLFADARLDRTPASSYVCRQAPPKASGECLQNKDGKARAGRVML